MTRPQTHHGSRYPSRERFDNIEHLDRDEIAERIRIERERCLPDDVPVRSPDEAYNDRVFKPRAIVRTHTDARRAIDAAAKREKRVAERAAAIERIKAGKYRRRSGDSSTR